MIRYLLQFFNNIFLTPMNKRHDDAIHNEARGRPVGLANSYGKTDKSILLRETFFAHLGEGEGEGEGGLTQERFSNFSNNRFFQAKKLPEKNLVSKEEYYRQHNFKQTKSFNLDKFGVGNYIPDLPIGTICILKL